MDLGARGYRLEHGSVINIADVPTIKGMLIRGDPQSDIAAYFGTNNGCIAQINTGEHYPNIPPAPPESLPPPGPISPPAQRRRPRRR